MALSDTEAGVAWIDNFRAEDRELARRLLDSFVLDSWTSARASLLELVQTEIDSALRAGPVWVLPAMDSGDIRQAYELPSVEPLTAFQNYEPGMNIPSMPGSEGLIGHLLRDVQGEGVLSPKAPISELRKRRIRTIFVVSDTVETGGQVAKYVTSLLRNPTLKSWRSFGWIELVVLTYAMSREGQRVITAAHDIDSLQFIRRAPTIDSLSWARKDVEAARDLCARYGFGKTPLGYGGHAGLFGFQDRVPNTVPQVFRQRGSGWVPLFAGKGGRQVPSDLIRELIGSAPIPVSHDQVVAAARQERLAISIRKQQRTSNRDILVALALLRTSSARASMLTGALGMTQAEVTRLLDYMTKQGWLDSGYNVTASGIAELAAGKRKPRRVEPRKTNEIALPYYPWSLR